MKNAIPVAIAGISGYTGQNLYKILAAHPSFQVVTGFTRQEQLLGVEEVALFSLEAIHTQPVNYEVLFLATPVEISLELVAKMHKKVKHIIDLSGAFRLPAHEFREAYGLSHTACHLLSKTTYGLVPWNKTHVSALIANPGCYATAALMALLPLFQQMIIKQDSLIIDAKSGVSGAGQSNKVELSFCEMQNNFLPYKVGKHQHVPEISHAMSLFTSCSLKPTLTTYLLPVSRGIAMTIYVDASQDFTKDQDIALAIQHAYQMAYQDYPLIKIAEINKGDPMRDQYILSLKSVTYTPYTHIGYFVKNKKIIIFCCLDNLLKGAASQAIENLNSIYNFPVNAGLCSHKKMGEIVV